MKPRVVLTASTYLHKSGNSLSEIMAKASAEHQHDQSDIALQGDPYAQLNDKRLARSIAKDSAFGLVAMRRCMATVGIDYIKHFSPERRAMFVGAQVATTYGNEPYVPAILATKSENGAFDESAFSKFYTKTHPTTLLRGLPNNLLCYGSMEYDLRGANSNYTSMDTSALAALRAGVRSLRSFKSDCAVIGAYSLLSSDEPLQGFFRQIGISAQPNFISNDAVSILFLERAEEIKNDRAALCEVLAIESCSTPQQDIGQTTSQDLEGLLERSLQTAGLQAKDLELIFVSGVGIDAIDHAELTAVKNFCKKFGANPIIATLGYELGYVCEASMMAELQCFVELQSGSKLPSSFLLDKNAPLSSIPKNAAILRASLWGDAGCIIVKECRS